MKNEFSINVVYKTNNSEIDLISYYFVNKDDVMTFCNYLDDYETVDHYFILKHCYNIDKCFELDDDLNIIRNVA